MSKLLTAYSQKEGFGKLIKVGCQCTDINQRNLANYMKELTKLLPHETILKHIHEIRKVDAIYGNCFKDIKVIQEVKKMDNIRSKSLLKRIDAMFLGSIFTFKILS